MSDNIKACFGTKEFSLKSRICVGCRLKKECRKISEFNRNKFKKPTK